MQFQGDRGKLGYEGGPEKLGPGSSPHTSLQWRAARAGRQAAEAAPAWGSSVAGPEKMCCASKAQVAASS